MFCVLLVDYWCFLNQWFGFEVQLSRLSIIATHTSWSCVAPCRVCLTRYWRCTPHSIGINTAEGNCWTIGERWPSSVTSIRFSWVSTVNLLKTKYHYVNTMKNQQEYESAVLTQTALDTLLRKLRTLVMSGIDKYRREGHLDKFYILCSIVPYVSYNHGVSKYIYIYVCIIIIILKFK